jgi:ribosomal-protein-alanine N-acetyltransferase
MKLLPYSTRPASEDDLVQVAKIEAEANQPPWKETSFRAELDKRSSHFWVITDNETDSQVLAYAVFSLPAEQAHIQTIAVHPDHRRKGIAAYLVRQILSFAMRNDAESAILEVRKGNAAAVHLYQSVGFVVIRTIPAFYVHGSDTEDGFVMVYKTDSEKLTGDPDVDFESDGDGKQNLN